MNATDRRMSFRLVEINHDGTENVRTLTGSELLTLARYNADVYGFPLASNPTLRLILRAIAYDRAEATLSHPLGYATPWSITEFGRPHAKV